MEPVHAPKISKADNSITGGASRTVNALVGPSGQPVAISVGSHGEKNEGNK